MRVCRHLLPILAILSAMALWVQARPLSAAETLTTLGQTPGGSAFRTEFAHSRLYTGVGTSLWIYNASDPSVDSVLARHPFRSLINDIVVRDDSVVFVAANHDGLWALDASHLPDLPILAHLETPDDSAAMDITLVPPDTLYLVDDFLVRILHFTGSDFMELERFAEGNATGADVQGDRIVVCRRETAGGVVELYQAGRPPQLVDTLSDSRLFTVEDVRFADLRDDVVYVCAGGNLGQTIGQFLALQIEADTLKEVGYYTIKAVWPYWPAYEAYIMDMDSRNDTLFLVTKAGMYGLSSDCPVLDGTCLPDSLPVIAHIPPGLWFFDVALHHDLPALAIASEWFGIRWMDISDLSNADTIAMHPTGGWGKKPLIRGDTLWLAWEGYGVGMFDVSDPANPTQIGRLAGAFATDLCFYDTLAFVARSSYDVGVYNLAPWYQGGEAEFIDVVDLPGITSYVVASLATDVGPRIACRAGKSGNGDSRGLYLIDPTDCPNFETVGPVFASTNITELMAFGDTLFLSHEDSIVALRISGDTAIVLAEREVPNKATAIGREGSLVAAGTKFGDVYLYGFTGSAFDSLGYWPGGEAVEDVLVKDKMVYASLGRQGLVVLDAGNPSSLVEKATHPGSGGWRGLFGTSGIDLGPDGKVYLSDENAGCFILEALPLPSPPAAITDLTATLADSLIYLSWSAVTEDEVGTPIVVEHYTIYRQSVPNFSPDPGDSMGSTAETFYDDPTPALKDTNINHYYVVKAVDSGGRKSADSNVVGELDIGLFGGTK